jgi:hypothetical protein
LASSALILWLLFCFFLSIWLEKKKKKTNNRKIPPLLHKKLQSIRRQLVKGKKIKEIPKYQLYTHRHKKKNIRKKNKKQ